MKILSSLNIVIISLFLLGSLATFGQSQFQEQLDLSIKSSTGNENVSYIITTELYNKDAECYFYYFNQAVDGIPIEGTESLVVLDNEGNELHSLNYFNSYEESDIIPAYISSAQALQSIYKELGNTELQASIASEGTLTDSYIVEGNKNELIDIDRVLIPHNGKLVNAYYTTLFDENDHLIAYTIDASKGTIISRENLTPHCDVGPGYMNGRSIHDHSSSTAQLTDDGSKYLAFSYSIVDPMHGDRKILTEPADLIVSPYGWHDTDGIPGPDHTITRGNNVYAYPDRNGDNEPDFDIDGGDSLQFIFDINLNNDPIEYTPGSATNLFVINNQLHDILAHNGFDELSGNFQEMNYSGQGFGSDPVLAHCQSRAVQGPLNNATFSTRDDGTSGVMRMFTWNVPANGNFYLRIENPYPLRRRYQSAFNVAGPRLLDTSITGSIAIVEDSIDISSDGCSQFKNAAELEGKIAVMYESDSCDFNTQLVHAQNAGAIAAIFIAKSPDIKNQFGTADDTVRIPSVMVGLDMGAIFENFEDTLEVTLSRPQTVIDGSLDQGVIAHELGHGISNRLVGGKDRTNCLRNGEQMGEGWSDIMALIMTTTEADLETRVRVIGSYVRNENPEGIGIRNKMYSPDRSINDYTYTDLSQTGGQVHNMGEIWATMLYDLMWNLIDKYGYDPDLMYGDGGNRKALRLIIEGMKFTNCNPGFVDGRDGILAADSILFGGRDKELIWKTFADRGLGADADQGSSDDHSDGKEGFEIPIYLQSRVYVTKSFPETALETDTINAEINLVNYLHTDTIESVKIVEYIPEFTTYLDGSASIEPTVTDDSLIFDISLADFDQNKDFPDYTLSFKYVYDDTRKNTKIFLDSMNYENLDSFKVGLNRLNNISIEEFFNGDKVIEMNGDIRYILQYFNPLKNVDLIETERNYILFNHRYRLNNSSGVSIKILGNEGEYVSTEDLMLINGYEKKSNFASGQEAVFNGNRGLHTSVVSLDPLNLLDVNYRITQYVTSRDVENNYWLSQVEIWNTDLVSSKICSDANGVRYCTEASTLIEPVFNPLSTKDPSFNNTTLYPNPADKHIYFSTDEVLSQNVDFRIIDISGKVVQSKKGTTWSKSELFKFDVSKLTPGLYILEVRDQGKVESIKFNKQ